MKEKEMLTQTAALLRLAQQQFIKAWEIYRWEEWLKQLYGERTEMEWDEVFKALMREEHTARLPFGSPDSDEMVEVRGLPEGIKEFRRSFVIERDGKHYVCCQIEVRQRRRKAVA